LGDRGHLTRGPTPDVRVRREMIPPLLELGVALSRILRLERGSLRHVGRGLPTWLAVSVNHRKQMRPIHKKLGSLESKERLGDAPRVVLFRAGLMAGGSLS
jgi:hypothetical protein